MQGRFATMKCKGKREISDTFIITYEEDKR